MLLSPPLAHPDADNSPSVSLCLLWREPCTSQPSAQAHLKPLSLFLQELFLCPLLSDFTARLFFPPLPLWLFIFLKFLLVFMLCSIFSVHLAVFPNPYLPSQLLLRYYSPSREINLPVRGRISLLTQDSSVYATVMESSPPPLSSLLSFTGSSSLALSLPELLLTFCLPTHFKFN